MFPFPCSPPHCLVSIAAQLYMNNSLLIKCILRLIKHRFLAKNLMANKISLRFFASIDLISNGEQKYKH